MKVLCVAEKPSIAKSITEILSGGRWDTVSLLFLHLSLPPSFLISPLSDLTRKVS
jgi:DNA topoisomerase IA